MTRATLCTLPRGTLLQHRRYGLCTLEEILIPDDRRTVFGVAIAPTTAEGQSCLAADSGSTCNRFLEPLLRQLAVARAPQENPHG